MKQKLFVVAWSKKTIGLTIFFFFFSLFCVGQDSLTIFREMPKNLVSTNIMGSTPFFGITYQRNLFDHLGIEGGIGVGLSYGAGLKYYFKKIRKDQVNFYFNTSYTLNYQSEDYLYSSLGFCKIFKNGLTFSADLGEYFREYNYGYYTTYKNKWYMRPWGRLGIGIHF